MYRSPVALSNVMFFNNIPELGISPQNAEPSFALFQKLREYREMDRICLQPHESGSFLIMLARSHACLTLASLAGHTKVLI